MSETSVQPSPPDQWHTNPWVWFVLCVPFTAVLIGVVMIVSANYQPDDLVVDNYYKEGKGINRRIRQDVQAAEVGAKAHLIAVTPEGVIFDIAEGSDALVLNLFHVTSEKQDLSLPLTRQTVSQYTASSALLSERLSSVGIWYLEIRDADSGWRLRQRIQTPLTGLALEASR